MATGDKKPRSLKIVSSGSLASRAAERLRTAIIDGDFALGQMIPEETLAAELGVSRTPVREALNELQRVGLVMVKPQRGSYVFEPTEEDITDICEFRCMLETQAAASAYRERKADALLALTIALQQMEHAEAQRNRVDYGHADTRFHEALFEHCANPYLLSAYGLVAGKIAALRTQLTAPFDVLRTQSLNEHRKFVTLFRRGDFAGFEALMRIHVDRTRDVFTQSWRTRQQARTDLPPSRA
jgi:DNA-binding GntR family transcriptional regulator